MRNGSKKVLLVGLMLACLALITIFLFKYSYLGGSDGYLTFKQPALNTYPDHATEPDQAQDQTQTLTPDPNQSKPQPPDQPLPLDSDPRQDERPSEPNGIEPDEPEAFSEAIQEAKARKKWMDAKLEQYREQIDAEDLEDFESIIGKLDMDHAAALLDNPDAAEGEEQLKAYLHSMLTADEYNRAKELFFKYDYILLD